MPTSYNNWPASRNPAEINVNTNWEPIKGHKFPGGTKGGDVEVVMTYLVVNLDKRVEPIEEYPPGDEWGYNYRPNVNNPNVLSCHASATAIDYNATQHPNQVDYTWTREQTRVIHQIIDDELDGVIKWLEGYDEMHFEIRGTPAQVAAVAKKIRAMTHPVGEEDMAVVLKWFKGEPTAPGNQPDSIDLYRVLQARVDADTVTDMVATYVASDAERVALKKQGYKEVNSKATAAEVTPAVLSRIVFHGGNFDNV